MVSVEKGGFFMPETVTIPTFRIRFYDETKRTQALEELNNKDLRLVAQAIAAEIVRRKAT